MRAHRLVPLMQCEEHRVPVRPASTERCVLAHKALLRRKRVEGSRAERADGKGRRSRPAAHLLAEYLIELSGQDELDVKALINRRRTPCVPTGNEASKSPHRPSATGLGPKRGSADGPNQPRESPPRTKRPFGTVGALGPGGRRVVGILIGG